MLKATLLLSVAVAVSGASQSARLADDVAGVSNITIEGHQVGLELHQDGRTVTGTLMLMGKAVPVDGEFVERALALKGPAAIGHQHDEQIVPLKITATLKDDGTKSGRPSNCGAPTSGSR